ncbi:MAG: hypothetical protein EOP19_26335 [Hyphomicrobiales bacterium]|nr:MAG: hypothetical protein EOP19_26335 [Hyphomicrobiales bacterium]
MSPGTPFLDAPLAAAAQSWLSEAFAAGQAILLGDGAAGIAPIGVLAIEPAAGDGTLRQRYALAQGAAVLLRPDGHVAARFREPNRAAIETAITRMEGRG